MRNLLFMICILAVSFSSLTGQEKTARKRSSYPPILEGAQSHVYKQVGKTSLSLFVYNPQGHQKSDQRPAIIFFFGGGWKSGTPQQFEQQCKYLSSRGIVAITADYRVSSRHDVKAVDCLRDAKSAVRWTRAHATELGIDPQRIAAGGGSAGGHLAACTATISDFDEAHEDSKISSAPNALVLYNPAAAIAAIPGSSELSKERAEDIKMRAGVDPQSISPAHHVRAGLPPSIMFFGTDDDLLNSANYFHQQMMRQGNRSELITYPGEKHGFFNYGRGNNENFRDTLKRTDAFLVSLKWLSGEPTVDQFKWD